MRLLTIAACSLLCALSISCSVASDEQVLTDHDDTVTVSSAASSCLCNPAPSSSGGWVLGTNPDGTPKENCSKCTDSAACSTGYCYYRNSAGSEMNVGCHWRGVAVAPASSEPGK